MSVGFRKKGQCVPEGRKMNEKVKCRIVRAEGLDPLFPLLEDFGTVWIVCDRNVWEQVGSPVSERLRGGHADSGDGLSACNKLLGVSIIDATEANKTMVTVESVVGDMLEAGADRSVLVLGIGGGIITDLAGFAASIYKRGVRFAFVPTTLLAQVDAAIGGKNGVNFRSYKNMIGVIRQPEFTYIYNESLKALPQRAFLSGVAELLKTFIIADADAYNDVVGRLKAWKANELDADCSAEKEGGRSMPEIGDLAARAAEIKASIVEQDPEEHGLRRVLNLGHTFAHAIEKLSSGRWSHGEAVAVGIILAARLAESLSDKVTDSEGLPFICEEGLSARLERDFATIGLPTESPYTLKEMSDAISKDKKAEGNKINFILPERIGSVKTVKLDLMELPGGTMKKNIINKEE